MKYYTINSFSKILGVTPQTIRNWDRNGKLHPHHTSSNGYRYYSQEQLEEVVNKKNKVKKITVGYCRVSSTKQKEELAHQVANMQLYLLAQGKPFEIIQDIGSSMNYKRKGLMEVLEQISENKVDKLVALSPDRLVRFGLELIESIASAHNCELEIINHTKETEQQELVEDLVQTVTAFSAKLEGKRANQSKKLLKELLETVELDNKNSKTQIETK